MITPDDIRKADEALKKGYLEEAKQFFSRLLTESADPVQDRIAENRLETIQKKLSNALQCMCLDIESVIEEDDFILCLIKVLFKQAHIPGLLEDLYTNSHRKNYPSSSSIKFTRTGSQQFTIELSGYGADTRCEWCSLYRKNIVYYVGIDNMARTGHCPLGFDA
jgi:uncharacterized protein YfcZ (UPF0381/DUF406 family)